MNTPSPLKQKYTSAVDNLVAISKEVEERVEVLEKKENAWRELEANMKANAEKAKTKITLDVGGTKFATTKTNLLQFPDSYFHAMLSSGHWQPDDEGCYFIDRDPKHFGVILNFLRTGKINLKSWKEEALEELQEELDYFLIKLPEPIPDPKPSSPPPLMWDTSRCASTLTIQGRIVTKTSARGWDGNVLGTVANPSSFKVKIVNSGMCAIMIGLAPKNTSLTTIVYDSSGWYIYALCGLLYSQQGDLNKPYHGSKIEGGSVVEVIFDKVGKSMRFVIDGVDKGVAFQNMNLTEDLYPCVCICSPNASVELV